MTFPLVMRVDGSGGANCAAVLSAAANATDDYSATSGAFNFPPLATATAWDSSSVGGSVVASNDSTVTLPSPVDYGRWVLVELEVGTDGTNAKLWVDGTLVGDLTGKTGASGLALTLGNLVLGSRTYANGYQDRSRVSITRLLAHAGARVASTLAQSTYGVAVGATSGGGGTPADTTAPTAPSGLTPSRTSDTAGSLSWTASTDAVGVTGYRVVRTSRASGNVVTADVAGTSISWSNLTAGSVYDVTVTAFDAAGNTSRPRRRCSAPPSRPAGRRPPPRRC